MHMSIEDREFWREILLAGGATALPRWTLDPTPGVGEHVATLPDDLLLAVRGLANRLGLPLRTVVLAAHAKVLAALSGEREVVTGYAAAAGGRLLPCPLTTAPETWRGLLLEAALVEVDLLWHRDVAVDELKRELGVAGPSFETVFDPINSVDTAVDTTVDAGGGLAGDAVLRVGISDHGRTLRLRYRTDALDPRYVERIASSHLAALALMVAGVDAEHRRQSLLSADELRL
jgi:non-ribosomal peptide synthetase component F